MQPAIFFVATFAYNEVTKKTIAATLGEMMIMLVKLFF